MQKHAGVMNIEAGHTPTLPVQRSQYNITNCYETDTTVKVEISDDFSRGQSQTPVVRPFVCGVCRNEFDDLVLYLSHCKTHNIDEKYWHDCLGEDKEQVLYTCGKCQTKFPSSCLLERHLQHVEKSTDFVINGKPKTAHILSKEASAELEYLLKLSFGPVEVSLNDHANVNLATEVKDEIVSDIDSEQHAAPQGSINISRNSEHFSETRNIAQRQSVGTGNIQVQQVQDEDTKSRTGQGGQRNTRSTKINTKRQTRSSQSCSTEIELASSPKPTESLELRNTNQTSGVERNHAQKELRVVLRDLRFDIESFRQTLKRTQSTQTSSEKVCIIRDDCLVGYFRDI